MDQLAAYSVPAAPRVSSIETGMKLYISLWHVERRYQDYSYDNNKEKSRLDLFTSTEKSTTTSLLPIRVSSGGEDIVRPALANYHPSVWGDFFVVQQFPASSIQKSEELIKQRVKDLVMEVKLFLKRCNTQLQELELIDALQRLGVAYHFEKEIDEALCRIHNVRIHADDLNFVSLRFRLLRQHGFHVSSDIFSKFKDDGQFKIILSNDAKGLLSLYEAAYLSIPGEDILDDAMNFTKKHLQSAQRNLEPALAALISHALQSPLRRRMERLEARTYIDIYQEDKDNKNDAVLELAKLDFHLLQLLHREEAKIISKWWIELGLAEKLTFARDRVMECYFWILGVYFEPHYSRARLIITKVIAFFSIMDDIYDAYGTMEELRAYTEQIERWNLHGVDQLNECIKLQYLALYDTVKDFENELAKDQLSYRVHYLKEAIKNTCRVWFKEAEWRDAGYIPSFKEYLSVALPSTTYPTLACASFVGMGEIAKKEAFEWILSIPKITEPLCKICRLMDDVVSSELEQQREHVASGIMCYMNEHGGSVQEVCEKFQEMVEDSWKELNQECLDLQPDIPRHLFMRILNLARVMETIYKYQDSYTHSTTTLKEYITLLLVQPIDL